MLELKSGDFGSSELIVSSLMGAMSSEEESRALRSVERLSTVEKELRGSGVHVVAFENDYVNEFDTELNVSDENHCAARLRKFATSQTRLLRYSKFLRCCCTVCNLRSDLAV